MPTQRSEGYVTVIGLGLVQPMLALVEKLESWPPAVPNEVQTANRENGFSVSIVVLAAGLFESAINRTAYVRTERIGRAWPDYFKQISTNAAVADQLEEVHATRNLILHSHLWEAKYIWDEEKGMQFTEPPRLRAGYGDNRHGRVIDPVTRKSRILKLNMFPSRIWRRDAYLVIKTVQEGVAELERMDNRYFPLSNFHFRFQSKTLTFGEIIERLTIPTDV